MSLEPVFWSLNIGLSMMVFLSKVVFAAGGAGRRAARFGQGLSGTWRPL